MFQGHDTRGFPTRHQFTSLAVILHVTAPSDTHSLAPFLSRTSSSPSTSSSSLFYFVPIYPLYSSSSVSLFSPASLSHVRSQPSFSSLFHYPLFLFSTPPPHLHLHPSPIPLLPSPVPLPSFQPPSLLIFRDDVPPRSQTYRSRLQICSMTVLRYKSPITLFLPSDATSILRISKHLHNVAMLQSLCPSRALHLQTALLLRSCRHSSPRGSSHAICMPFSA